MIDYFGLLRGLIIVLDTELFSFQVILDISSMHDISDSEIRKLRHAIL